MSINAFAQTKQEIYCNSDIVWAGIVEVDFVVNADTSTDWMKYELNNLHHLFRQKTAETNPKKALNEIIIENADVLQFYRFDSLKHKLHYQELDIRNWAIEPDTYGDDWERIPASEFNVFRLKCLIYYDKSTLDFKIVPQAVAVLFPTYDFSDNISEYNILGWLPVEFLSKVIKINDEKSILNFQFQRDFPFDSVKVFKQEWTTDEVINNFMATIRRKAEEEIRYFESNFEFKNELKLYQPYEDTLMEYEEIQLLGLDEIYGLRFDADFEEKQEFVPWSADEYKGIRFSMNWFWNDETKSLSILTTKFAPLILMEVDFETVLGTRPFFWKEIVKKDDNSD